MFPLDTDSQLTRDCRQKEAQTAIHSVVVTALQLTVIQNLNLTNISV